MFLYLEGLCRFQSQNIQDPLSYYGIAGIHGIPYQSWPEGNISIQKANPDYNYYGFCTHSSMLFLSWHRPFLALFESQLYKHVNAAADSIDANYPRKADYQKLARNFRIPYWDWARRGVMPVPKVTLIVESWLDNKDIFISPTFQKPPIKRDPSVRVNYNPLFTYPFPRGVDTRLDTLNVSDQPNGPRNSFGRTVRYPQSKRPGDDLVNTFAQQRNLPERLAYLMKAYQRFGPVCYNDFHGDPNNPAAKAEVWGSIEDIHNTVHDLAGGGGHMSLVAASAFDPIFWLHHANVDRLFAIWQALHEGANPATYVTPARDRTGTYALQYDQEVDEDTPLWPFRRAATQDGWWTSRQVQRTETFGYVYPETSGWTWPSSAGNRAILASKLDKEYTDLPTMIRQSKANVPNAGASLLPQAAVLRKLSDDKKLPATAATAQSIHQSLPSADALLQQSLKPDMPLLRDLAPDGKYLEWLVNIKVQKHAFDGRLKIHIFVGAVQEENVTQWPHSPNYVGSFVPLGQAQTTHCDKCQQDQANGMEVTGQIPLTLALTERYLAQIIADLSPTSVVPFLTRDLHWRVSTNDMEVIAERGAVPGLKLFVVSNEVTLPANENEPPIYADDVRIWPEITTNRNGAGRGGGSGLTNGDLPAAG